MRWFDRVGIVTDELQSGEFLLGPSRAMEGLRVDFILPDGAVFEFMQFDAPKAFDEPRSAREGRDRADLIASESPAGARFGVVAVAGEHAVGSGMVLGDGATFAYLKDIMVRPGWQARGLGTRIVDGPLAILRRSDHDGMLVTLFTGQHLAGSYERFGFSGPETLHGMSRSIERPAAREAGSAVKEAR
jgi:GNAT superfamily N-acetyltransferase